VFFANLFFNTVICVFFKFISSKLKIMNMWAHNDVNKVLSTILFVFLLIQSKIVCLFFNKQKLYLCFELPSDVLLILVAIFKYNFYNITFSIRHKPFGRTRFGFSGTTLKIQAGILSKMSVPILEST